MAATAYLIRELPEEEKPRERLLERGPEALSDAELVALLLRTGSPGTSSLQLATGLLKELGGLGGLVTARFGDLARPGLREAKATTLLAACELGRRMARVRLPDRLSLDRPGEVARYLGLRYAERDQEVMGVLLLDVRNRLLGERELYRGTLDRTAVEPREVLKEGLLRGAAAVVLFHTHPSGDPAPSVQDLAFTGRLAEACEVVGLRLVDHLILGYGGSWVSLRDRGGW